MLLYMVDHFWQGGAIQQEMREKTTFLINIELDQVSHNRVIVAVVLGECVELVTRVAEGRKVHHVVDIFNFCAV